MRYFGSAVQEITTAVAFAAITLAPLHAPASEPSAAPPAADATPDAAAPAEEQTPEERAKALGWDEEDEAPAAPPPQPEEAQEPDDDDDDDDDGDEEEEPDDDDGIDVDDIIDADPDLSARYKKARGLAIGGGSVAGVGFILAVTGGSMLLVENFSRDATGGLVRNDGQLIAGWALTGVGLAALAAGAVVLGLGLSKRKGVIIEAEGRLPPEARVAPWFGKRSAGMSLHVRF